MGVCLSASHDGLVGWTSSLRMSWSCRRAPSRHSCRPGRCDHSGRCNGHVMPRHDTSQAHGGLNDRFFAGSATAGLHPPPPPPSLSFTQCVCPGRVYANRLDSYVQQLRGTSHSGAIAISLRCYCHITHFHFGQSGVVATRKRCFEHTCSSVTAYE